MRLDCYDFDALRDRPIEHVKALLNASTARYINIDRDDFIVMTTPNGFTLLYDGTGGTQIGSWLDVKTTDELLVLIEERSREWSQGIVRCADCGNPMRRFSKDIAGRYFAGVYDEVCWNREWRERAAKETYE